MALKSYCGNKKVFFESEKRAFSALGAHAGVPIIQCFGSYTHDYGEGLVSSDPQMRKTCTQSRDNTYLIRPIHALTFHSGIDNLLLEFGERDLYQYWNDEVEVPPVRSQEIMRYWEQLFEIADAIRQVHLMDVTQGRTTQRYFGYERLTVIVISCAKKI
jgi:hypothetical protein